MALSPEEIADLKSQLREQVAHLPPQQKEAALMQIESMSASALESLVQQQREKNSQDQKPIFRAIVERSIPVAVVTEDDFSLVVLDIFPISKGHTIIIPKTACAKKEEIPKQSYTLAQKLAAIIKKKLKANSVDIIPEEKFQEAILNILPSYQTPLSLQSPRSKSTVEELDPLAKKLRPPKVIPKVKLTKPKPRPNQVLKLQRHIP